MWLLEELNLEYNIKVYKRGANRRAGPELKAVHPLGKSPVVTIRPANSEKDIVIAESETIMEYICDHFGKQLVPARYPEGQEGVLGAETEEWMRYKVRYLLSDFLGILLWKRGSEGLVYPGASASSPATLSRDLYEYDN